MGVGSTNFAAKMQSIAGGISPKNFTIPAESWTTEDSIVYTAKIADNEVTENDAAVVIFSHESLSKMAAAKISTGGTTEAGNVILYAESPLTEEVGGQQFIIKKG